MKTYKCMSLDQAFKPTIRKLKIKQNSPIYSLKIAWNEIAPDWAKHATPFMIKNKTLFMKAGSKSALILQYKEMEIISIVQTIVGHAVNKIKIISN